MLCTQRLRIADRVPLRRKCRKELYAALLRPRVAEALAAAQATQFFRSLNVPSEGGKYNLISCDAKSFYYLLYYTSFEKLERGLLFRTAITGRRNASITLSG
jgi:hypothetical protein